MFVDFYFENISRGRGLWCGVLLRLDTEDGKVDKQKNIS